MGRVYYFDMGCYLKERPLVYNQMTLRFKIVILFEMSIRMIQEDGSHE